MRQSLSWRLRSAGAAARRTPVVWVLAAAVLLAP
jgi:hypothetical protein